MSVYTNQFDHRLDAIVTGCYVLTSDADENGQRHYCEAEYACWDTGATNTSISPAIIEALQLKAVGKTQVSTFGGHIVDSDVYVIDLMLPGNIKVENLNVLSAESEDYDVVIGMDVMTLGDLCLSNKDGKTCFSFRLPSKEHIVLSD